MYRVILFRYFWLTTFLILAEGTALRAQFFQATMSNQGATLIVKVKPNGGNITTTFANMEFFIRYPNTSTIIWSAPTVNTTNFPNAVIQKNDPYTTIPDAGYTIVRFFLPPGIFTTSKAYTSGTEYEVFRTNMTGTGTLNLEMMHRDDFTPYYLALDSETADMTGSVKFYGMGASPAGAIQSLPLSVVVPLDLLDFTAQAEAKVNKLNWETANEVNTSHFSIEKSVSNGDKFVPIGEVKTNGFASSTPQYYTFADAQPSNLDYYRLKMVDKDGQFTYSKIITLARKSDAKINYFPNPASHIVNVQIEVKNYKTVKVELLDISGKIVATQSKTRDKSDSASFVLDVEHVPNGIYTAAVTIDGQQSVHKITIAK
ncbi:MAG: T9SS type A sorting domain-containing protein [Saprospiraceae bacterium]|nr:T9SS type A sorting domain-containing protein [Saprospiraceae bacterium]